MVGSKWHIGRKGIIAYLTPFLDLSDDQATAWNKIRRWRRRYGLPVQLQPNGKPYVDEAVFEMYWKGFQRKTMKKRAHL